MSARSRRRRTPAAEPTTLDLFRMQLSPIQWGKRDPALARGVCRNILEATPPRVIAFNPLNDASVRRELRLLGAASDWNA